MSRYRTLVLGLGNGLVLGVAGLYVTEHPVKFFALCFMLWALETFAAKSYVGEERERER